MLKLILLILVSITHAKPSAPAKETACEIGGFVIDKDPAGLNVRNLPSAKGTKIGVLPAPVVVDDIPVHIEVEIIASKEGWFKIKNARDNSSLNTKALRRPFNGEGWVSGHGLAVKSQAINAYSEPSLKSKLLLSIDMTAWDNLEAPQKLLSCEGKWAYLEFQKGKKPLRAWVNQICNMQETSCSGLGDENY